MDCSDAGNRAAQADELEVLQSIYGDDCVTHHGAHSCEVFVHPSDGVEVLPLHLCIHFPHLYPSSSEPIVEIKAPWLLEESRLKLSSELHTLFIGNQGNVVVFTWVEWLKEQPWLWEEARRWSTHNNAIQDITARNELMVSDSGDEVTNIPRGSRGSPSKPLVEDGKDNMAEELTAQNLKELDLILGITHGDPFTEKKSTFQAHLASVSSVDQVETVMEALLRNRKVAGATHNIMAYRICITEKNTVLQDYDDDGESAAGGRLLHLLQIVDAINVVVVVSRWFGGTLLGPDRFKHINNCARSLLNTCGYIKGSGQPGLQTEKPKLQSKGRSQKGRKH